MSVPNLIWLFNMNLCEHSSMPVMNVRKMEDLIGARKISSLVFVL